MITKLKSIEDRYKELNEKVSDPDVIADMPQWQKYIKEHASIEPVVLKYREYKQAEEGIGAKCFSISA